MNLSWRHAFAGVQEGWTIKIKAGSQIIALIKHFARKWKVAAASIVVSTEGRNLRAGYVITEDMACTIRVDRGQGGASSSTSPASSSPPPVHSWHREQLPPRSVIQQVAQAHIDPRPPPPPQSHGPMDEAGTQTEIHGAQLQGDMEQQLDTCSTTVPFDDIKKEEGDQEHFTSQLAPPDPELPPTPAPSTNLRCQSGA